MQRPHLKAIVGSSIVLFTLGVRAQGTWSVDTRGGAGPIAQVALPDSGRKRRSSFIAFEYARKCDPIFSFIEVTGSRLGTVVSQSVLNSTKIGVVVNGKFWTWNAATTKYNNGYEAGFGITNELLDALKGRIDSLVYVTPAGEHVQIPTAGFPQAVQSAFDTCAKRFR